MDLARVKYCIAHIGSHPESLTHCNGVDMAYFLPEDVRGLIAEVERLSTCKQSLQVEVDGFKETIQTLAKTLEMTIAERDHLKDDVDAYKDGYHSEQKKGKEIAAIADGSIAANKTLRAENSALMVRIESGEAAAYMQGREDGRESMREDAAKIAGSFNLGYSQQDGEFHYSAAVEGYIESIPAKEPK